MDNCSKTRDPSVISGSAPHIRSKSFDIDLEDSGIKVYLRIRPQEGDDLIDYTINKSEFTLFNNKNDNSKSFSFSHIFQEAAKQSEVYKTCVSSLIHDFINGNNGTIMAYGTSGAGKTYSMLGTANSPGIVPRVLYDLFRVLPVADGHLFKPNDNMEAELIDNVTKITDLKNLHYILKTCQSRKRQSINAYSSMEGVMNSDLYENMYITNPNTMNFIWISFAEIYNENLYDLLDTKSAKNGQARPKLKLINNKHDAYCIKGITRIPVRNGEEAYRILKYGQRNLQYAATKINASSSRSHCIFTLYLVKVESNTATVSFFNFCDLAGSERVANTQCSGMRLKEAQSINSALHILGRCIKIVKENQKSGTNQLVPFRESKLTRLLHKALMGQERLSILVNLHPKKVYFEETLNSLNFAATAKSILLDSYQCSRISRINVTKFFNAAPCSTIHEQIAIDPDGFESDEEEYHSYTQDELFEFIAERDARIQELELELQSAKVEMIENEKQIRQELADKFNEITSKRDEYYENIINNLKQKHEEELKQKELLMLEQSSYYESDEQNSIYIKAEYENSENDPSIINISDSDQELNDSKTSECH